MMMAIVFCILFLSSFRNKIRKNFFLSANVVRMNVTIVVSYHVFVYVLHRILIVPIVSADLDMVSCDYDEMKIINKVRHS